MTDAPPQFPRIRNLPKEEQAPFRHFLRGQTCPCGDPTEPITQWDWYYQHDYDRWKAGLPVVD